MNRNITAIVYTRNEEKRLPLVWENFRDFCQVIVFDGGSTDGTEDFCKKNNIKFVRRPSDDSSMELESHKWVYRNTPTEYVIRVFCAHYYPSELLETFSKIANENKYSAVYHDVVIYRYGAVVHKPILRRVASCCNFYKKSSVDFAKSKIHDEAPITFNPSTMLRLPGIDNLSLHLFQDEDCVSFTTKTIKYCELEASQRVGRGEKVSILSLSLGPIIRFVYRYFRLGSFTMGASGLIYSILNMIYDYNVSIIMWEMQNKMRLEDAIVKNLKTRHDLFTKFQKNGSSVEIQ